MTPSIVTIGAYGFGAETFFAALQQHGVDTFVDIRRRRGVRGAQYAFANSNRLQSRLAELGIRYVYLPELAPTTAVRQIQHQADTADRTAKRKRTALSPAFAGAFQSEILAAMSPAAVLAHLPNDAQVVALFCVERVPEACHRSLVATWLSSGPVVHIMPAETPSDAG